MSYNYITIEGCIGAGKTTLATMLAKDMNAELILERFMDNNFLPKFYKDPEQYAFPVEMSFLTDRYQQLKMVFNKRDLFTNMVISDYFIDKCVIFSKNNLKSDEYKLFRKVYEIISNYMPKPDLLVYLYNHTDRLLKNIAKRGREYEQNITADYLSSIQDSYILYFKQFPVVPVLILEADKLDFVNNPEDYNKIKEVICQKYPVGITRITF